MGLKKSIDARCSFIYLDLLKKGTNVDSLLTVVSYSKILLICDFILLIYLTVYKECTLNIVILIGFVWAIPSIISLLIFLNYKCNTYPDVGDSYIVYLSILGFISIFTGMASIVLLEIFPLLSTITPLILYGLIFCFYRFRKNVLNENLNELINKKGKSISNSDEKKSKKKASIFDKRKNKEKKKASSIDEIEYTSNDGISFNDEVNKLNLSIKDNKVKIKRSDELYVILPELYELRKIINNCDVNIKVREEATALLDRYLLKLHELNDEVCSKEAKSKIEISKELYNNLN